jgi:hypothetical protein
LPALLGPSPGVATNGIVATLIAPLTQFLEDPDQCQLLTGGFGRVASQQRIEFYRPAAELRSGLDITLVFE